MPTAVVSFKSVKTERGSILWFVTIDGRILGDSRPYSTADEARDEAIAISERSIIDGVRTRIYRPGY